MNPKKPLSPRTKYKVRVLHDDFKETVHDGLDYHSAVEKFMFYVSAVLEFNLNVRCVNIMNGKGTIKMFQNR